MPRLSEDLLGRIEHGYGPLSSAKVIGPEGDCYFDYEPTHLDVMLLLTALRTSYAENDEWSTNANEVLDLLQQKSFEFSKLDKAYESLCIEREALKGKLDRIREYMENREISELDTVCYVQSILDEDKP